MNDASVGVGDVNDHRQAEEARIEIPEESGRSKRKRVQRQLADALNGCLCGLVLDSSSERVLKCKQAGCETLWVSTLYYERCLIFELTLYTQYHLQCVELEQEPRNWVCVACEASGRGREGKRQRR